MWVSEGAIEGFPGHSGGNKGPSNVKPMILRLRLKKSALGGSGNKCYRLKTARLTKADNGGPLTETTNLVGPLPVC